MRFESEVPVPKLATYTLPVSESTAISSGKLVVVTAPTHLFVAGSTMLTLLEPSLAV